MTTRHRRFPRLPALVLAPLVALVAGCGGDDGSKAPDYDAALRGSPPRLAALHAQANELLDGGLEAFEARLAELRGFPVVVNVWASWCGPCRVEFPHFQKVAAREGDRVAFLGVDADDSDDAAATFLESYPVPYPHYVDPDLDIVDEVTDGSRSPPATAFYDSEGNRTHLKIGQYATQAELAADVRRYAR